jgi:hypothetical protein
MSQKSEFGMDTGQVISPVMSTHLERLRQTWNKRVQDPFAFIPHEERNRISENEALEANIRLGNFATDFLKNVMRESKGDQQRQIEDKKKIVAVGYGKGFDSLWFKEATVAGFRVCWIDISDVACGWADTDLDNQYYSLKAEGVFTTFPVVTCGDIRHVLNDPGFYNVNLDFVEMWYLCRVLNCMSIRSAQVVLQKIGSHLARNKNSIIVLVNAFRDNNLKRIGKTSKLFSMRMVLSNIRLGTGVSLEMMSSASYQYFDQTYSAVAIRSK